jgi:hypothetical protein
MIRKFTVLFFALSIASFASANPFGSTARYVAHHKAEIARDFITGGGMTANAIAAIRCQHENPTGCMAGEFSPFGAHPSEGQVLGFTIPLTAVIIASNHIATRFAPDKEHQNIPWAWTAPLGVANLFGTITELQNATPSIGGTGRIPPRYRH